MTQIFISYSRRDLDFVEQLATDLQAAGLDVWYDLSGLEGGSRWSRAIEKAIHDSQYVLVVLSPDSVASKWVEEEFLYASELGKKIIPLFYRQCSIPFGYRTLHFIDVQGSKYKQKFNKILRSLDVKPVVPRKQPVPDEAKPVPAKPEKKLVPTPQKNKDNVFPNRDRFFTRIRSFLKKIGIWVAVLSGIVLLGFLLIKGYKSARQALTSYPAPTMITDEFGVEMMLVPAGEFQMGSAWYEVADPDERPAHIVYLASYYIDKYEVTNKLYIACKDSGACSPPNNSHFYNLQSANHPVVDINWNQASDYCKWREARLPTEAEWEKAARGTDGRTYPWGEWIDCSYANYCETDTTEVGQYEKGKSPYGIYDMSGNVFEWMDDWYEAYPESTYYNSFGYGTKGRVLRGGGWELSSNNSLRSGNRTFLQPQSWSEDVGFRCAKDATP